MRKHKGFSLIELLIVVAIILIIAAIAIPNLLKAKMASNESSAAAQLRTFDTAEVSYLNACGAYAISLAVLGPNATEGCDTGKGFLDNTIAPSSGNTTNKSGYKFTYTPVAGAGSITGGTANPAKNYSYGADPLSWGSTGKNSFCTSEDNVVHKADGSTSAQTAPTTDTGCQALPTI
jgi:prepilin-type N-terminal cleavage/methylation domain-containing protein